MDKTVLVDLLNRGRAGGVEQHEAADTIERLTKERDIWEERAGAAQLAARINFQSWNEHVSSDPVMLTALTAERDALKAEVERVKGEWAKKLAPDLVAAMEKEYGE